MSTKDFRTRNEIVVTIPDGSTADVELKPKKKKRAAVPPGKTGRRFLHRRRQAGNVNFWDLGQVKSGSVWVDLPFSARSEFSSSSATVAYRFQESDWHLLGDQINAVPKNDWKTYFRKLEFTTGEKYGVDIADLQISGSLLYRVGRDGSRRDRDGIVIDGTDWTDKGLTVNPAAFTSYDGRRRFAVDGWAANYFFDNFPDYSKVTTLYDPTAANVPFTLGATANVFLMPRIVSLRARRLDTVTAFGTNSHNMFTKYRALSREFWLERSNGSDFLPNIFSECPTNLTLTPTNSADLIANMAAAPGTTFFRTTWPSSTPSVVQLVSDPGSWQTVFSEMRELTPIDYRVDMIPVHDPAAFPDGGGIASGILVGIIEQGGTYYYFWRTSSGPNYVDLGGPCHIMTLS